eukprot:scaffold2562_cov116-Isochrysis_galbana.AAC.2
MASGEPAVERKGSEKDEEERKEEDLQSRPTHRSTTQKPGSKTLPARTAPNNAHLSTATPEPCLLPTRHSPTLPPLPLPILSPFPTPSPSSGRLLQRDGVRAACTTTAWARGLRV